MSTYSSPAPTASAGLLAIRQWAALIFAIGIVIQALLAGQGFYESRPGLVTGHGHLGNTLFLISVGQLVLAFVLAQRRLVERSSIILTVLIALSTFAQIGLGYVGRTEASAMAWHLPNGVLLMALSATYAAIAFTRRVPTTG